MKFTRRQSGFTLVEIAIVLVIIGLLLGGVLKGQELINNAKFKSYQNTIRSYQAAIYSFLDRYKATPGDMATASTQLNSGATNGNGNGWVDGGYCSNSYVLTNESCNLFSHLRYANLIPGDPTSARPPSNSAYGFVENIFSYNLGNSSGIWYATQGNLIDPKVAARLDRELDDGIAGTGDVACYSGCPGGNYPTGATPVAVWVKLL